MKKQNCKCGNYLSYGEHIRRPRTGLLVSRAIAPMMPLDACYNCHLIKHEGTTDPVKIKENRAAKAKLRLAHRNKYRDRENQD